MLGEITKNSSLSAYQPREEVKNFTSEVVRKDYGIGIDILHRPWPELNNHSVLDRMDKDQRTFQSFVDEAVENPEEAWEWRGTRSLARKKAFAMHAHLTSSYIVPEVFPQNGSQEDDRLMASAERIIMEWAIVNSDYRPQFLLASMGMLVDPVTYFQIDYNEVYQKIREKTKQGYQMKEILDEVLSGISCHTLSANQVLITNAYEQNIQKQRAILKRRYVEKSELEAKYGEHENWGYLQSGVRAVYNDADGLFYDIQDEANPNLIEEAIWENRREDGEVCFLGGIYFGDGNLEANPIRHRDNFNAPKYDITPFGYHRINKHFFYYASLMFEVGWDDKLIDAMYQMTMNRGFLDLKQPTAYIGFPDKVDTSVVFPGASISTPNPEARVMPIIPPQTGSPYRALQEIEDSMSEGSLSETQMGNLPEASQKAYTVAKAEQNAKILLSGVSKSLAASVEQVGNLLIDVIHQHLTIPEIEEITGNLKYREFVLDNQIVGGKKVSKKIRFDESLMGRKMDEKGKKQYAMKIMEEIGYPDNKEAIYVLNPHLFSKTKFLCRVEADEMLPVNKEFDKVIMERLYELLKQNPTIDLEALTRELLYASRPQSVEELMSKQKQGEMNQVIQQIMGKNTQLPGLPANAMSGVSA